MITEIKVYKKPADNPTRSCYNCGYCYGYEDDPYDSCQNHRAEEYGSYVSTGHGCKHFCSKREFDFSKLLSD